MAADITVLFVSYPPHTNEPLVATLTIQNKLKELQALVGGYLERVRSPIRGLDMWVNEEGHLMELPARFTPFYPGPIAGNYFFARSTPDGDMVSVTEEDELRIRRALGVA